jgi:AcrR family transcriptional regulator
LKEHLAPPPPSITLQECSVKLTRRGEAKRAAILEAATERFLQDGYDGVSVDEIVRSIGGSKTNVYNYFGGKEGLFAAAVAALCDKFLAKLDKLEPSRGNTAEVLGAFGHTFLDSILNESHLAFVRLILSEARRFPEIGQVWYSRGPGAITQYIGAYLEQQQRAGAKLKAPPQVAAQMFHSMATAGILQRTLATGQRPTARQRADLIDAAIGLILG